MSANLSNGASPRISSLIIILPPRKIAYSGTVLDGAAASFQVTAGAGLLATPTNPIIDVGVLSINFGMSATWTGVFTFTQPIVFAGGQTFPVSISGQSTGDLMYYSGSAWVRLGIGSAGQLLKVNAGLPSWQTGLTSISTGFGLTGGTITTTGTIALDQTASCEWTNNQRFDASILLGAPHTIVNASGDLWMASNALYSTGTWNRSDISKGAYAIDLSAATLWTAAAGSNPISWTMGWKVGSDLSFGSGGYGVQLLGGSAPYARFVNTNALTAVNAGVVTNLSVDFTFTR